MQITLIANPTAGRGRTERFLRHFTRGHAAEILWTERPGHASDLARTAVASADIIGVFGGDGTVHEVVNGLMPDPVPIVVVPTGSGNDFASLFTCPRTPDELARVLDTGTGVRVDVIDCGECYCVNSIGMGFEALVTRESLGIRHLTGLPLYLLAVARALRRYQCPRMTITTDDQTYTGARLLVSAGNGVRAGGGFYLTPDAVADDGAIDLCIVACLGRARLLRLLPLSIKGRHTNRRGVTMSRSTSVTITSETPYHRHIDGEYVGERDDPMTLTVLPRRLPVLCSASRATRAPLERLIG